VTADGARQVTAERWAELARLYGDMLDEEIPLAERPHWVLAPLEMNFTDAQRWARRIGGCRTIALNSGETMVRLPKKPSPWGLP
jgi:hypothetical protein